MKPLRYEELLPVDFDAAFKTMPVCYVPIGSIEWHGEHMPLGVDAVRARMIVERASERFGGIVYPPIYSGIPGEVPWPPAYGYDGNVMITEEAFRALLVALVRKLKKVGFRGIFLVTGHHCKTQTSFVAKVAAEEADEKHHIWGNADPALEGLYGGDHAGFGETSFMLAGRPDLVRTNLLEERGVWGTTKDTGKTPAALRATAADGRKMIESAADSIGRILVDWGLLAAG
jgi:creatinine amidohydrolase